ncbi:MAG: hypothetical protein EKK63_10945 [Acinetobacter sp.]|uniref:hypothetical protein n=1 Tax=Acinetobacter sp. TaxID=472 RepID=UPI000F90DF4D|nr:hypothetical protein [Acinetobacter sp.]RUP38883.1 MAG: hypothetical protein EKK63_10945 [Acinetobacter sp.]
MKEIIARILATANLLDAANLPQEADKLTKIAQDFSLQNIADMLYGTPEERKEIKNIENDWMSQHMPTHHNEDRTTPVCPHNDVEYGGNDGVKEVMRWCWGTCRDCGAELEGYEQIDGADDETGEPDYVVVKWREASAIKTLIRVANTLDEKGLHKFADTITKIAQDTFDPKLHQLGTDIGKMFTTPPQQQDIYAELKTFLSSLTGINTNYTKGNEVMIGAGMANYIKSEAQRLLEDLKEYTGEEEENLDGPSDEWLEGTAERNFDNQQMQDKRDYTDSMMSEFPTTDWLDKYKSQ